MARHTGPLILGQEDVVEQLNEAGQGSGQMASHNDPESAVAPQPNEAGQGSSH